MECRLCGFRTPPPDKISMALMAQHLADEHGDRGPLARLAAWDESQGIKLGRIRP